MSFPCGTVLYLCLVEEPVSSAELTKVNWREMWFRTALAVVREETKPLIFCCCGVLEALFRVFGLG